MERRIIYYLLGIVAFDLSGGGGGGFSTVDLIRIIFPSLFFSSLQTNLNLSCETKSKIERYRKRTNGLTNERMDGQTDGQTNGRTDRWMDRVKEGAIKRWISGQRGRTDGWKDGRTDWRTSMKVEGLYPAIKYNCPIINLWYSAPDGTNYLKSLFIKEN